MEEHKKFGLTDFFMLLAVLIWAINFSFIKIALREFPPLGFNGLRLVLASLMLIFVLLVSKEGLSHVRSNFWQLCILGIIGNTIYQILFIHGLNWTTASNTSIVMAMTPIFVALLSTSIKHERLHWAAWMGILVSFAGFYFVITKQAGTFHFSWLSLRGDLMIFFGNFLWAVYTVFSKPLLDKISPLKLTAITMVFGSVFYIPFAAKDITEIQWVKISFQAWAALIFSALFVLAISYVIWYASVKRVGNSRTAIYGNITPVFTVVFAYIFLGERITLLQAGGALIIFAGIYLTRMGYRYFGDEHS